MLRLKEEETIRLIIDKPENLSFHIPFSADSSIEVELYHASIFTPDFKVVTGSGNTDFDYEGGVHYRGVIKGDTASICAISIFKNQVMGLISSTSSGNFTLGKLKNTNDGLHIFYNTKEFISPPVVNCLTYSDSGYYQPSELQLPLSRSVNCIRLYWEVNYDIYADFGTVNDATNYIVGLFNQSALLFTNDNIPVELSQVFVWDTISPYTGTSTSTLLNQFKANRNSFAGDLAHLLGYEGGGGIAASINGLCSPNPDYSMCYSKINPSYQNVPTYSWSVSVVTHEQGHLMGSRHTHACVWNGNNTAIDGCGPSAGYPYEGSCSGAPIPSNGGTIMSYCHLTSTGVNFSNGFGSQPAAVIINNYNNASCLSACTGGSFCSSPSGLSTTGIGNSTATLNWISVAGAISYYVQFREAGSSTWFLDSTSVNSYTATGLNAGITYEWQVQARCSVSTSIFSSLLTFITIPTICYTPTGITTLSVSSVTARFNWVSALAAIGYNIQYRILGSSTWLTATTTTNSFLAINLTPNSQYEFQVQTICAGGGTSTFSGSELITTLDAGTPVTVTLQPNGQCGKDALLASLTSQNHHITNFGDNTEFNSLAWTIGGVAGQHRSLIQFDLSFIPAGSGILNATLSLYWNPVSSNPGHSSMSGSNSSALYKLTAPWAEYDVTWINQPPITTSNSVSIPASTASNQNYLNLDVSSMIQDFVNNPNSNYGMMLKLDEETAYRSLIFASSDHPNDSLHPKLEITYAPNLTECKNYQYSNCHGIDAKIGSSISAGYNNSNYGDHAEFFSIAWTNGGSPSIGRTLTRWDLSEIPSNAVVSSATLYLYWNPISSNPGHSSQSGSNESQLLRITAPWDEHTLTWDNQPGTDTVGQAYLPASINSQQDYVINVTNLVQGMITNPATNYGMMLKLINESYYRSLIFCSSDYPDPARHPRLEICYAIPTSVNEVLNQSEISIHSLNDDLFKIISGTEFPKNCNLLLYSSDGKLLRIINFGGVNYIFIPRQNLSSGIYFYRIFGDNFTHTGKIIFR